MIPGDPRKVGLYFDSFVCRIVEFRPTSLCFFNGVFAFSCRFLASPVFDFTVRYIRIASGVVSVISANHSDEYFEDHGEPDEEEDLQREKESQEELVGGPRPVIPVVRIPFKRCQFRSLGPYAFDEIVIQVMSGVDPRCDEDDKDQVADQTESGVTQCFGRS